MGDNLIEFLCEFIPEKLAKELIHEVKSINSPDDLMYKKKLMLHQTYRLVSLANDILIIRPGKESLQLLFLLICAEHIAKLYYNYSEDGKSKYYTKIFFSHIIGDADKQKLERSFCTDRLEPMSAEDIANALYNVRCGVVHEGNYWDFHFHDGKTQMLNINQNMMVKITVNEFKAIVVNGCINAVRNYSPQ